MEIGPPGQGPLDARPDLPLGLAATCKIDAFGISYISYISYIG
ncbi:hypothetical protein [Saccharopolyspora sp. ASAGF58]|nr:hypothetical protein [Saccharopolyspora sp. ASAGF58]